MSSTAEKPGWKESLLANGNGAARTKLIVELVIVVFQTITLLFLVDIRWSIKDQESRIKALEVFAGAGSRWSGEKQVQHEHDMEERLRMLWRSIDALERP